jgi:exportin-T
VTEPLFGDLQQHIARAKHGDAQALLQIHHMLMALGTVAYGVADATPGAGAGSAKQQVQIITEEEKVLSEQFARVAEAVLIALRELHSHADIRQSARSAFSRLIGVLGAAVLPQLPQWIEGLLSSSSSNDEMALFLRLLDQVIFGFKAEIYDVLNQLLTPLLERCLAGLAEPLNGTDDVVQMAELRREYLSFLNNLLTNNLEGVFISSQNQGYFERLVSSILGLACHVDSNTANNRLAFGIMARMATIWGGPDVATISATPSAPSGSPSPVIPGFDAFLIEHFHGASWKVLENPQFRASDAQAKQLLAEVAALEQTVYLKTGALYLQAVAKMGVDQDEYMMALATSTDKKTFAAYLAKLLARRG